MSEWGEKNIEIETEKSVSYVRALASACYDSKNMGSSISSGSFKTDGMGIVPCSMKTLSSIANGYDDGLISKQPAFVLRNHENWYSFPGRRPFPKFISKI